MGEGQLQGADDLTVILGHDQQLVRIGVDTGEGIGVTRLGRRLTRGAQPRPKVGNLVTRGLRGLFGNDDQA